VRHEEQSAVPGGQRYLRFGALLLIASVLAAGCSTTPPKTTSEPSGGGGGYYLDDGPGSNPPGDLGSVPDAVPKAEPLNRAANRPYSVFGHDYVPMTTLAPYKARGVASWYGRRYHGQRTSIGEVYDMYSMSAAHPTLPLPCYVRVTNLANGRSVVVRVNDRGPFLNDRLIDLSYAAANRLGYIGRGSAMVEVELIVPGQTLIASAPSQPPPAESARPEATPPEPPIATVAEASGVYLQLGAFSSRTNADLFRERVAAQLAWLAGSLHVESGDGLHRVRAGPYRDRIEALVVSGQIREALEVTPVVVVR
jgi:peptidoglycan lytic transglycosylase